MEKSRSREALATQKAKADGELEKERDKLRRMVKVGVERRLEEMEAGVSKKSKSVGTVMRDRRMQSGRGSERKRGTAVSTIRK